MNPYGLSNDEIEFVKSNYPEKGAKFIARTITRLTVDNVYQVAYQLQIRSNNIKSYVNKPETPEQVRQIIEIYKDESINNPRTVSMETTGLSRMIVQRIARQNNALRSSYITDNWSNEEDEIIERFNHLSNKKITKLLRSQGYNRSYYAVCYRRDRLKINYENIDNIKTTELALLFGVTYKTILCWIKIHGLKAKKVDEFSYTVTRKNLKEFIIENPTKIDLYKIHKASSTVWFIDLITNNYR